MQMYSLLDNKALAYGGILLANSDGHVSRVIQERFVGSGDTIEKYPEDFDLYALGEFSLESGEIEPKMKFVCNVAVILQQKG